MSETKAKNSGNGRHGVLIYVVDDEPMLLELTSVILRPLGHTLKTFPSADHALAAIQQSQESPELIITDYAMHKMTGMDLIEETRRINPRQKVLLVSGTVGEEIYSDSTCKPDAFLAKPYQAKELIDLVKSLLAQ